MKSKLRLNATNSSIKYSTPPFASTMLAEVVFYFFVNCCYYFFVIFFNLEILQ